MSKQSRRALRATSKPITTKAELYEHCLRHWATPRYLMHPAFQETAGVQDPRVIYRQQHLFAHVCQEIVAALPTFDEMVAGQTYAVRQPFVSMIGGNHHGSTL